MFREERVKKCCDILEQQVGTSHEYRVRRAGRPATGVMSATDKSNNDTDPFAPSRLRETLEPSCVGLTRVDEPDYLLEKANQYLVSGTSQQLKLVQSIAYNSGLVLLSYELK